MVDALFLDDGRKQDFGTGSSPVLTTEGTNPETQKDKVGDSWKDSKYGPLAQLVRAAHS